MPPELSVETIGGYAGAAVVLVGIIKTLMDFAISRWGKQDDERALSRSELRKDVNDLQASMKAVQAENARLIQQDANTRVELAASNARITILEASNEAKDKVIAAQSTEIAALKEDNTGLRNRIRQLEQGGSEPPINLGLGGFKRQ